MPRKNQPEPEVNSNGSEEISEVTKSRNVVPLDTKVYHWIMDANTSVVFFVNHKVPIGAYTLNHATGLLTDFSNMPRWDSTCRAILRDKDNPAKLIAAISDTLKDSQTLAALAKSFDAFIALEIKEALNSENITNARLEDSDSSSPLDERLGLY